MSAISDTEFILLFGRSLTEEDKTQIRDIIEGALPAIPFKGRTIEQETEFLSRKVIRRIEKAQKSTFAGTARSQIAGE